MEILPPHRSQLRNKPLSPEKKAEIMSEIKEKEEKEEKNTERVAEKVLNELENIGIKCPRCGLKNVRENKELIDKEPDLSHLECLDCKYRWKEER